MGPASFVGIGIALFALMVGMIMDGGSPAALLAPSSMLLIFGGTLGAATAGMLMSDAKGLRDGRPGRATCPGCPTRVDGTTLASGGGRTRRTPLAGSSSGTGSPLPTSAPTFAPTFVATCSPTCMAGTDSAGRTPASTCGRTCIAGTGSPGGALVRARARTPKSRRPHAGLPCSDARGDQGDDRGGTSPGARPSASANTRSSEVALERRRRRRAGQHRDVNGAGHRA